ncbi:MAG: CDP-diacylglycerol--glycerol-3-phosphate 3-phosphatidyltransferase [Oscillospiraceae bacterium]|nr:CDP-diacylglycerol--glycerol-3-phosphate 3-phosphatidyltransferase [Oscillospiraceae bacterium]
MTTANKITLLRAALIPVFLVLLYLNFRGSVYAAAAVFALASVSDFVDGHIARKYNQVTDFGKFMDPLADKALVFSAIIWFVGAGIIPVWVAVAVITREFAVTALRLVAAPKGVVIAAAKSGKVKTAATMIGLIVLFLPIPGCLQIAVWCVILLTTIYSGAEYFIRNRLVFKEAAAS